MAQQIQPWRPSTTSSLESRAEQARAILQCATSPREALEAGKKLIGQWPHAKPADPETYAASIGAVLAQYPFGLVRECVDPRVGLAKHREFPPTVACLTEWLDKRLAWYQAFASHQPRPAIAAPVMPSDPEMAARVASMLTDLAAQLRASAGRSPLEEMISKVASARRLRLEEIARHAGMEAAE